MWGMLCAAVLVLALTPVTVVVARRFGLLDRPSPDRPRVHKEPVPRIGGVAIAIGILVPLFVIEQPRSETLRLIGIGAAVVALVGLVDDLRGLKPSVKFGAVALAALIPVAGRHMVVHHVGLPVLGNFDFGWVAYPLTVLWIAVIANLVNLIDGMDALAAGMVAISCAAFAILAASFGRYEVGAASAIVMGACIGFLRHNYHPAKVFMGDTGALTLGFILGALAVEGVLKSAATIALAAPLLIMAVPILDTSFVVLKRLKYRRPPWAPDQNHFYHRFMRIGFSQRRTAAYLHLWAALLAAWAVLLRFVPPRPGGIWDRENTLVNLGAALVVLAASIWMVYVLEILKVRHLNVLRLRRRSPAAVPPEPERERAVEEVLTAGPAATGAAPDA